MYANVVLRCPHRGLQKRGFFTWINYVFNKVDENRVKAVGPDRAAAEWILRLGGLVKFSSFETWSADYNRLPSNSREEYKLEAIDASGISVTDNGLEHLAGLHHLQALNLSNCKYLRDSGLVHLTHVKDTLEHLDLSCNPGITDEGLPFLYCLRALHTLNLANTPSIKHREISINKLKQSLPLCTVGKP